MAGKNKITNKNRENTWHESDYEPVLKKLEKLTSLVEKKIDASDKLLKIVENSIKEHNEFGDPLTLDPGSAGYEEVMELYLKILKAQDKLLDQYRKLQSTNLEFSERQEKISLRKIFLDEIRGKSLDEIRKLAIDGEFEPTNLVAANLLADGSIGSPISSSKILGSLSGWNSEKEEIKKEVIPRLTINLSSDDKKEITMDDIDEDDIIDIN